jgi:hypothetical protein
MNVFVSRPTSVGPEFESAYSVFHQHLLSLGFALRRLGGGDYSKKPPLRAVIDLLSECCGALVLGYPQSEFQHQARRSANLTNNFRCVYPTPWNQIEGALAYAHGTPVLVVAHPGIDGGVFDHGITGEGVVHIGLDEPRWFEKPQFDQPFQEWAAEVQECSIKRARTAQQGDAAGGPKRPAADGQSR